MPFRQPPARGKRRQRRRIEVADSESENINFIAQEIRFADSAWSVAVSRIPLDFHKTYGLDDVDFVRQQTYGIPEIRSLGGTSLVPGVLGM